MKEVFTERKYQIDVQISGDEAQDFRSPEEIAKFLPIAISIVTQTVEGIGNIIAIEPETAPFDKQGDLSCSWHIKAGIKEGVGLNNERPDLDFLYQQLKNTLPQYNFAIFCDEIVSTRFRISERVEGETDDLETFKTGRQAGSAKGLIEISEDFDKPLEDFQEYR